jgi:hypothetical protein
MSKKKKGASGMKKYGSLFIAGAFLMTGVGCSTHSDSWQGSSVATSRQGELGNAPLLRAASVENVMEAERVLKARGYDPGRVDGDVSPQTIQALRAFQRANQLQMTGDLDRGTIAELNAAGARFTGTLRAMLNPPGPTDSLSRNR